FHVTGVQTCALPICSSCTSDSATPGGAVAGGCHRTRVGLSVRRSTVSVKNIGNVMNGVTGRMGAIQHLVRSIVAIRDQGGVRGPAGTIMPQPILVGRNRDKLASLAAAHGLERYYTDLDEALEQPDAEVYFDALATNLRAETVHKAIAAGKHVYCEKPIAEDVATALGLARAATAAGVKNGVVQDKLFLPGLLKLARLLHSGFFGEVLAVRGEFGY